jgi:DNA-binding CsgD family transcriptional regulator
MAPSSDQSFRQTLDQVYAVATDASAFGDLSSVMAKFMQAANGVVFLSRDGVPVELSATTSAQAQQEYLAYYGQIDIWKPGTFEVPPFVVTRSRERISDEVVLRSEFYRDYARHLDMWHPIGLTCPVDSSTAFTVGVNRTRAGGAFDTSEEARLVEFTRHLQRALQLRRQFQQLQLRAHAGYAALDRLAFGALVVDASANVVFANAAAEELERSAAGLTLAGKRLGCAVLAQARDLRHLVHATANGGSGGALRITDASGAGSLLALVSPMPSRLTASGDGGALVLVALRQAKNGAVLAETVVAQLFGLSRSEAQVVRAVVKGASIEEIARERGVKITTIKTQLEAAYRKTDTENQRDLIRLLSRIPQLR